MVGYEKKRKEVQGNPVNRTVPVEENKINYTWDQLPLFTNYLPKVKVFCVLIGYYLIHFKGLTGY